MDFLRSLRMPKRPYRPTMLKSQYLSERGKLHVAGGVENQDSAFSMMRPEEKAFRRKRKRGELKEYGCPGVYAAGVFDGHGPRGGEASALAAERMEYAIDRLLSQPDPPELAEVARMAFKEIAAAVNSASCSGDSGTTGSVVLVREMEIVVAHVGDSSVLMISAATQRSSRMARYLSPAHRPTDENEAKRILQTGGYIREGFVVDKGATKVNTMQLQRTLFNFYCEI